MGRVIARAAGGEAWSDYAFSRSGLDGTGHLNSRHSELDVRARPARALVAAAARRLRRERGAWCAC